MPSAALVRFLPLALWMAWPAATATRAGDTWPGFHNGGNTSVDAADLPLEWSPRQGISWRAALPGYGQSAPVVWKDRVYVTAVAGEEKETLAVLAHDASTGKRLWKRTFPATLRQKTSYMVSRAAPTPLADERGLYVLFESGDLRAMSHEGEPRWSVALFDDGERAFQNSHGYGASPAQTADAVIVLVDHRGPSYLRAVSKASGETLWKTERTSRSSWASPQVANLGGRNQIVVSSGGTVDGYDAQSGRRLWSHEGIHGNLIPSATVLGDRVFVGASVARRDPDEQSTAVSNCCLRIVPDSDAGYELLWRAERALCHYVSPLVHRGHAYYVNKVGVLYCLDAATGRRRYAKRIGGPCWAQPIASGDRLYFFGKDGETTVLRSGPTFEPVASNRLWDPDEPPLPERTYEYDPESETDPRPRQPVAEYLDPIVYGVAAVDGAFFVRLGTHLYRVGGVD